MALVAQKLLLPHYLMPLAFKVVAMEVVVKYFARPGDFASEDLLSGNEQKTLYAECPGFENLSQPAPAGVGHTAYLKSC